MPVLGQASEEDTELEWSKAVREQSRGRHIEWKGLEMVWAWDLQDQGKEQCGQWNEQGREDNEATEAGGSQVVDPCEDHEFILKAITKQ